MANILTNLRELSVGVAFFYFAPIEDITPAVFRNICIKHIKNFDSSTKISASEDIFEDKELQTITNGIILGKKLKDVLHIIDATPLIEWRGNEKDDLIDLRLNGTGISLKEDSFILKNMGLYALLNILTNTTNFKRGLHIFTQFAPNEFETWFKTALNCLLSKPVFDYVSKHSYKAHGKINGKDLILSLNDKTVKIPDFLNVTYSDFVELTNSDIREKVFCKWLSNATTEKYYEQKRNCAFAAGNRLQKYINDNIVKVSSSVLQLFNLESEEYIYAKSGIYNQNLFID